MSNAENNKNLKEDILVPKSVNNDDNLKELIRSIPILASTGNTEALNKVLDLIEEMRKAIPVEEAPQVAGKYLYARVLTTADGTKHYHPIVTPASYGADLTNPASYKMTAKDTVLELQNDGLATSMKRQAEYAGYVIQAVFVTDEVYEELKVKLNDFLTAVIEGTRGGAMQIAAALQNINSEITADVIQEYCMRKINEKPYVAGSALDKDGAIVDKAEYVDEKINKADNLGDYDNVDEECDRCDNCDCYGTERCEACGM